MRGGDKEGQNKMQLIDERGEFDEHACESFLHDAANAHEWNKKYAVMSIMGPQSSGKSTLMNHAFGTSFREMDELSGRRQTTKGVWMAIAEQSDDNNNNTIVLDLEGSDGRERGEDDQTFEKQTALFALAASDVLLVNVWCNDIGREHASGKPLLKTILQVNLKLFCSNNKTATKKTKLVFVIRDRSKTPIELLEKALKEDVEQVWQSIKKPEHFANSDVSEFFDVGYFSLPHYLHENEVFVKECKGLRAALISSTDDESTHESKVPSTALPTSMREIWKAVQENRDLDLPAHAIMVATVRCEEIATMCADAVEASDAIGMLCERANTPNASECTTLGKEIEAIAKTGFDVYDAETAFFDKNVRDMKRRELAGKLTTVFKPTLEAHFTNVSKKLLTKVRRELDAGFESGFEKKSTKKFSQMALSLREDSINEWNEHVANSTPTENIDGRNFEIVKDLTRLFHKDLEETVDHEKTEKSALLARNVERTFSRQVSTSILGAVDEFSREICVVDDDSDDKSEDAEAALKRRQRREEKKYSLWPAARLAYRASEKKWIETLENALLNFDLPKDAFDSRKNEAENAIKIASNGACFEAGDKASEFMRQSFSAYFNKTKEGIPRVWTSSDDVGRIARLARLNAVNVLANICINRIGADMPRLKAVAMTQFQTDEAKTFSKEERMKIAKVEKTLRTLVPGVMNKTGEEEEKQEEEYPLSGGLKTKNPEEEMIAQPPFPSEWSLKLCDTKASDVILSPSECRQHYRRFESETTHFVAQALHAQQNAKKDGLFGGAPVWMIFALFVLGWNEIVYFLTHPFRLMFFVFLGLYARAILRQINAKEAFKLGVVPGCAFLVAKGVPAAISIFQKLIEQQSPEALTEGLDFSKVLLGAGGGGGETSANDEEEEEVKRTEEPMDIDSPAKKVVVSPFASVRRRTNHQHHQQSTDAR
jgi:nicotinamide riboside kinase